MKMQRINIYDILLFKCNRLYSRLYKINGNDNQDEILHSVYLLILLLLLNFLGLFLLLLVFLLLLLFLFFLLL